MASKVRYLLNWGGGRYKGDQVCRIVEDAGRVYLKALPVEVSLWPRWKRIARLFELLALPRRDYQLTILREPRRTNPERSRYIAQARRAGVGRPLRRRLRRAPVPVETT